MCVCVCCDVLCRAWETYQNLGHRLGDSFLIAPKQFELGEHMNRHTLIARTMSDTVYLHLGDEQPRSLPGSGRSMLVCVLAQIRPYLGCTVLWMLGCKTADRSTSFASLCKQYLVRAKRQVGREVSLHL